MEQIQISVIMAIHNENHTLIQKAVESVLNQTFPLFELIFCNDASNQETVVFLEKMKALDQRICLVSNKTNRYAGAARNLGIRISHGRYIAIMDPDDICEKERLEREYQFLETHPEYAYVCCEVLFFDGVRKLPNQFDLKREPQPKDFLWGIPFVHPTMMIRKSCLDEVGGYSEEAYNRRTEDYDLMMRLYAAGYRGYNLEDVLYRYYVNPDIMKRKRLYRYRIDEARIRMQNFQRLGLLPYGLPYVIKPLLVGLIPHRLLWRIKKSKKGNF